ERRGRELVERNLRFVGRALRERGAGAGLERGRQRLGDREGAADEREEELKVGARVARRAIERAEELLDRGISSRHAEGRRLVDRQRPNRLPRRNQQRDDAAVRVADEMVAGPDDLTDLPGLLLKVDALQRRGGRIAGPGGDREVGTPRPPPDGFPRRPPRSGASPDPAQN